jgi:hypothetical protein
MNQVVPIKANFRKCPTTSSIARFEDFTAVTMKNTIFWDIKPQFVITGTHHISAIGPSRIMLYKI